MPACRQTGNPCLRQAGSISSLLVGSWIHLGLQVNKNLLTMDLENIRPFDIKYLRINSGQGFEAAFI
jgi:hypothetical protein